MSTPVTVAALTLLRMATFQQRLRECVADKGISEQQARRELAQLTGMGRANLSHWFGGRAKEPKGTNVIVAARYFGVEPLWFAKGEGPKRSDERSTSEAPPGVVSPLRDAIEIALAWQELPDQERDAVRRLLVELRSQYRNHATRTREQWKQVLDDIRANSKRFESALDDEETRNDSRRVDSPDDRARATTGAGHPPDVRTPPRDRDHHRRTRGKKGR